MATQSTGFGANLVGGVGSAIGGSIGGSLAASLVGDKQPSGGELGKQQRAYLDSAFPELNAWEKAGAGQSGAASSSQAVTQQGKSADKSNALQYSMMNSQIEKTKAETALTNQRTKNEATATSPIGRTVKDVGQMASDAWNGVKGTATNSINPGKPATPKERLNIKMSSNPDKIKKIKLLWDDYKNATTSEEKGRILNQMRDAKRK